MDDRRWKHAVGPVAVSVSLAVSYAYMRPEDIDLTVANNRGAAARLGHEFGAGTATAMVLQPVTDVRSAARASTRTPPAGFDTEGFTVILRSDGDTGH